MNKMPKIIPSILTAFMLTLCTMTPAKNLGTFGQTYPIMEQDFLDWIKSRLHALDENGTLETLKKKWQNHIKTQSDRPSPIYHITTTKKTHSWLFDPTITVKQDITDTQGTIIAKAGQRFNPLTMVSLETPLLFFNGDEPAQINWVKLKIKGYHQKQITTKPIAIKGSIKTLTKTLQQAVYFDQGGRLVAHFKIEHIPASITQEGIKLRVTEESPKH